VLATCSSTLNKDASGSMEQEERDEESGVVGPCEEEKGMMTARGDLCFDDDSVAPPNVDLGRRGLLLLLLPCCSTEEKDEVAVGK